MPIVKCPTCNAMYEAVYERAAQQPPEGNHTQSSKYVSGKGISLWSYMRCFKCSKPSSSFVNVPNEDIPPGVAFGRVLISNFKNAASGTGAEAPLADAAPSASPSTQDTARTETHYLDVPREMVAHAELHGAKFDTKKLRFYVVGNVPNELFNFLPKEAPKAKPHVVAPMCPICTYHMEEATNTKDGSRFYKCAQSFVPNCRGTVDYERHLESIGQTSSISAFSAFEKSRKKKLKVVKPKSAPRIQPNMAHKIAVAEIGQLGLAVLGNLGSFESWVQSPKLALGGRSPLEEMRTLEGCKKVAAQLRAME